MALNKPSKPPVPDPRPPRIPVEYVNTKEAAAYLGVAKVTLDAMRQAGTGPEWVRVSARRVVYPIDGIRRYTASRTVTPSPAA